MKNIILTKTTLIRLIHMFDMVKNFYYKMYHHNKQKLLSKNEWKSWEEPCKGFFSKPYVIGYWENNNTTYADGFDKYIDRIILEAKQKSK